MSTVINSWPIWGYLLFFIYLYYIIVKFQNTISDKYPDDADKLIGTKRIWGINQKSGLFFLWDNNIKQLIQNDHDVVSLRRRCVISFWIFLSLLIVLPFTDIIGGILFR